MRVNCSKVCFAFICFYCFVHFVCCAKWEKWREHWALSDRIVEFSSNFPFILYISQGPITISVFHTYRNDFVFVFYFCHVLLLLTCQIDHELTGTSIVKQYADSYWRSKHQVLLGTRNNGYEAPVCFSPATNLHNQLLFDIQWRFGFSVSPLFSYLIFFSVAVGVAASAIRSEMTHMWWTDE